ncbi:helix-turn-helix transcriptional regulator [Streptomyces sp. NPDC057837]|uniref:helix-turn-helix transcriptional regulator n=1 Tax=Streptomyces sp. NPDC057837 TaxID=3346260 RepID=UPI0036798A9B
MAREWARLGERLKAGRIARGMEQQEVASQIGVKRGAVRNIEVGKVAKVTMTIRAYARLIDWTDDSVERVLDGGEPTLREPASAQDGERTAGSEPASDLSLEVQESLRRGPLLRSLVKEVKTPTGRVRATIVIRGEDGQSPEELLEALRSLDIEISAESDAHSVDKSE